MIQQAQTLLTAAAEAMQTDHDARSAPWQESVKAEELLANLERLQESVAELQNLESL